MNKAKTVKKRLTLSRKNQIVGLIFISPWLLGFLLFFARYMVQSIAFSLSALKLPESGGYRLVPIGFRNYIALFTEHPLFNRTLVESLQAQLTDLLLIIVFSLFMAILLNSNFKGRAITRAIFFLPVIMASPAISAGISGALTLALGGINTLPQEVEVVRNVLNAKYIIELLYEVGVPESVSTYILGAIDRIYSVIRASGVQIIIFLAALQSVSNSLYEVAEIEGATAYETFFKITLPMISPLILTNVFYTIIDSYNISPLIQLIKTTSFVENNYGLSAAMSVASALAVGIVLMVFGFILNKVIYYQD
jgi:ABC-type sugar transport system permease subunit